MVPNFSRLLMNLSNSIIAEIQFVIRTSKLCTSHLFSDVSQNIIFTLIFRNSSKLRISKWPHRLPPWTFFTPYTPYSLFSAPNGNLNSEVTLEWTDSSINWSITFSELRGKNLYFGFWLRNIFYHKTETSLFHQSFFFSRHIFNKYNHWFRSFVYFQKLINNKIKLPTRMSRWLIKYLSKNFCEN